MMKMNKWTMALAAAGVVSLSSVAQAQEAAAGADALAASTTLSGYVSTSYTMTLTVVVHGYWRSNEDNNKFKLGRCEPDSLQRSRCRRIRYWLHCPTCGLVRW